MAAGKQAQKGPKPKTKKPRPNKPRRPGQEPIDPTSWLSDQRPDVQEAYRQLKSLLKKRRDKDPLWWHDVGTQILKLHPPANGRRYGGKFIEGLCEELLEDTSDKSTGLLYIARKFAEGFKRREVQQHCVSNGLKVLHFKYLVQAPDDQRMKLLDRCCHEEMSAQELREAVQEAVGHRRSRGGRRPELRLPKKLPVALRELKRLSVRWQVFTDALLAQHHNGTLPTAQDGLQEELQAARETVREMGERLRGLRELLTRWDEKPTRRN